LIVTSVSYGQKSGFTIMEVSAWLI
jgi:hypothetical protein